MEFITKPAGGGKTHQLIKMCSEQGGYIVCSTQRDCERVFAMAKSLGCDISFPISWHEFINNRFHARGVKKVYIDDLDRCLEQSHVEIVAVTCSEQ